MRLVEVVSIVASVVGIVVSVVMAVEQRLIARLRREGATSPETAIELPGLRPVARWRMDRLRSQGAAAVDAEGRWRLEERGYHELQRQRRVRAVVLVAIALAAVVLLRAALH